MRRFINSVLFVGCAAFLLGGCSDNKPSAEKPAVSANEAVLTVPETAPKEEPATSAKSAVKKQEEPENKGTEKTASAPKSTAEKPSVSAAPKETAQPAKDYPACLAAWDGRLNTLQTHFTQTTEYDGISISQSLGRIFYEKSGPKLRLDSLEENVVTQTALTDQKKIYILDEKGKEISNVSWEDWLAGQPNQALFDFGHYAQLLAKHQVQTQNIEGQTVTLCLTPTDKQQQYVLYLLLDKSDCFPRSIIIEADLMKTSAVLRDPTFNAQLDKNTFKGLK